MYMEKIEAQSTFNGRITNQLDGLTFAIMIVFALPPSESWKKTRKKR